MFTKVFMDKLFRLRGSSRDAASDEMMSGIVVLWFVAMSENPEGKLTPHVSCYCCSPRANPLPCPLRAQFLAITTSKSIVRLLSQLFPPRIARPTRTFLVLFCSPPRICLHTAPKHSALQHNRHHPVDVPPEHVNMVLTLLSRTVCGNMDCRLATL